MTPIFVTRVDQVGLIVKAGLWPKVAVFVTRDDGGVWWDHGRPTAFATREQVGRKLANRLSARAAPD